MKQRAKRLLREMAEYVGFKVNFVSYFGDQAHGLLLSAEKRILINAH
jgi:hypothetical protein